MPIIKSEDLEENAVNNVVEIMAASARTAPKTMGIDTIETAVIIGQEKDRLAKVMEEKGSKKQYPLPFFKRDADNVRNSLCVLLIGVRGTQPKKPEMPLNCGACGFDTCAELIAAEKKAGEDFTGPLCIWNCIDLGIALGSAVKTASIFNIDNRMMYSIGAVVKELDMLQSDLILGIPLSVKGKNIFYDRK